MPLINKVAALLEALTAADVAALPPFERRRFADLCRRCGELPRPAPTSPRPASDGLRRKGPAMRGTARKLVSSAAVAVLVSVAAPAEDGPFKAAPVTGEQVWIAVACAYVVLTGWFLGPATDCDLGPNAATSDGRPRWSPDFLARVQARSPQTRASMEAARMRDTERANLAYRILLRNGRTSADAERIARDRAAVEAVIEAEIGTRR